MKNGKLFLNVLSFPKAVIGNLNRWFVNKDEVPDYKSRGRQCFIKAFTLIELLVVVLIIGILSAIAIPMYQGAVDKSHWSTMLPGAKAIKDAEEAIKMTNGAYTNEMANLDVTMNNSDLTFALVTPDNTADPNVIRVTNSKLANVRLASYLDDNPKFAGQLHCEAKTGDERAERLCGKLLMGQELTSADGYTGYLLDQEIDQASCDNASRSWSTSKTKCYKTTADRCEALGSQAIAGQDMCGIEDQNGGVIGMEEVCRATHNYACNNMTIKNGGMCMVAEGALVGNSSCASLTIDKGAICISYAENSGSCYGGAPTKGAIICGNKTGHCGYQTEYDNGVCITYGNSHDGCWKGRFKNNSVCYGITPSQCGGNATYDDTSCCCGDYCGNAPKCSVARCEEAIAPYRQYLK